MRLACLFAASLLVGCTQILGLDDAVVDPANPIATIELVDSGTTDAEDSMPPGVDASTDAAHDTKADAAREAD